MGRPRTHKYFDEKVVVKRHTPTLEEEIAALEELAQRPRTFHCLEIPQPEFDRRCDAQPGPPEFRKFKRMLDDGSEEEFTVNKAPRCTKRAAVRRFNKRGRPIYLCYEHDSV